MQLLAVVAVTGAAPVTVGVILCAIGTVPQAGCHGHRAATVRWTPRGRSGILPAAGRHNPGGGTNTE